MTTQIEASDLVGAVAGRLAGLDVPSRRSVVFSGVTRNSLVIPSRFSMAPICGPPPCTTTGCRPTWRRNTMSWAKAALSESSSMALPP